jgi:Uma2 family endonuclease
VSFTAKILPYYTIADWEQWEGKWELIEGIPYAMSPSPLRKHQRIAGNLYQEFNLQLKDCKPCKVYNAIDWQITNDTVLQPDVLIVCGNPGRRLNFPPQLTVEILSPATASKDRNSKFYIYEEQKVKYYLMIDSDMNTVEAYIHNGEKYQKSPSSDSYDFSFENDRKATINFMNIWE